MEDIFTISSSGLPDGARVVGFRGHEAISKPYALEIFVTIASEESHALDLGDAVNSRATLTLDRRDGRQPFAFHGVLAQVSLIHEMGGRALIRLMLVPRLWRLGQTRHSRIFTGKSVPDIIKEALEDGGLSSDEYAFKLTGQYKPEEHVCQYHESHLDFISRWMEREGLYYYFDHEDGQDKLIISDNRAAQYDLIATKVRFAALGETDVSAQESLHTLVCRHNSLPGMVRFKDHDYTKPQLDVAGDAPVSNNGLGEINIHGARFFSPADGKRLARLRSEEMLAREVVFTGSGTAFFLRSGFTFSLEGHPRQSFDTEYLATEVEHYGNQAATTKELRRLTGLDDDEVYRVNVTAIPAKVQYRAELRTVWPRIYGTEHGVIDGEIHSDYAQIDDHGRYLVRFAFDESTLGHGKASTRVRMMQPHGGGVEGWHFPLRKGTEVLFTFLGGDPDRPVIAGVVPNAHTPSPVTSGNHTRNVIQTGGRNRLEIEDKAGQQRITLSTPHANTYLRMGSPNDQHELIVHTDQNALIDAGANFDIVVGGNKTEYVKGSLDETIVGSYISQSQAFRIDDVTGDHERRIHGSMKTIAYADAQTTVHGGVDEKFGSQTTTVFGGVNGHYGTWTIVVDGAVNIKAPSVNIDSPKVKTSAESIHTAAGAVKKSVSALSFEFYGGKNSIGGEKVDFADVSLGGTMIKLELTGMAIGRSAVKADFCNARIANEPTKLTVGSFGIASWAVRVMSAGLTKIG
jgi:type VI secretion system secreted protein VgrG